LIAHFFLIIGKYDQTREIMRVRGSLWKQESDVKFSKSLGILAELHSRQDAEMNSVKIRKELEILIL
jgi:hypothetical protein